MTPGDCRPGEDPRGMRGRVSVIIITRNRPALIGACLSHLRQQTITPEEIIVVDSSTHEDTQAMLDGYPEVMRLRIPYGHNNRPQAKNVGVARAGGEIVIFLDDDSMVQENWLSMLLAPYADESVGGVAGRVLDVVDHYEENRISLDDLRVGIIEPTGRITSNFALDTGRVVEVDHFRGCNMSFRRAAIKAAGGFDARYFGTNVLEEADLCIRVKRAGWRLLFQPAAVVHHLSAPRQEFDRAKEETAVIAVGSSAHNRAYFYFRHFGVNYRTARNLLGGWQILFVTRWWRDRCWQRFRAIFVYGIGAWWGLFDSVRQPAFGLQRKGRRR
jgi:GT2 family glycosyltransferase